MNNNLPKNPKTSKKYSECLKSNCTQTIHPASGIHSLCLDCYNDWCRPYFGDSFVPLTEEAWLESNGFSDGEEIEIIDDLTEPPSAWGILRRNCSICGELAEHIGTAGSIEMNFCSFCYSSIYDMISQQIAERCDVCDGMIPHEPCKCKQDP